MHQHEVAHSPIALTPVVSLNLGCYVDQLWRMSGDYRDPSDNDDDSDNEDADGDDEDADADDEDADGDDEDADDDDDDDDDGDEDDDDDGDENDENGENDENDENDKNDKNDKDDSGPMDIYQRALHRMVSRFITTKPCAHLIARIANLTGLDVDQTQRWFDKEHLQQLEPTGGPSLPLLWIHLDTGEPFPLLPEAYREFFRRFYVFTKYTWRHRRCRTYWPGSHYWFFRVVELYWERLQSKRYSGCTVDLPSLRKFP